MKWVVLAVAATLALAGVAQAVPPSLTYDCDPSPDDCAGWFRVPVELEWDWPTTHRRPEQGELQQADLHCRHQGNERLLRGQG